MSSPLAVAIVHGTGRKDPDFADDPNDVLGFPISALTERYRELAGAGYLEDRTRDVGGAPLAHRLEFEKIDNHRHNGQP